MMRWSTMVLLLAIGAMSWTGCTNEGAPVTQVVTADTSADYVPMSNGSYWVYHVALGTSTPYDYRFENGPDTTLSGLGFHTGGTADAGDSRLFRRQGSRYYQYAPDLSPAPFVFLETEPVGATWEYGFASSATIHERYRCTLAETGLSRTVNGRLYPDVIRVHMRHTTEDRGAIVATDESDHYYAKDVGPIEMRFGSSGAITLLHYAIR